MTIPVVDIGGWARGDRAGRERIAGEVDHACRTVGFFQIVGHGIDAELVAQVKEVTDGFFSLPLEEKQRYLPPSPEVNRGYAPRRSESLAYSLGETRPADLVEAFVVGDDRGVAGDPYFDAERGRSFAPNLWPTRPPLFQLVVWDYFLAVRALSQTLCDIAAQALELPPDFFTSKVDRAINTLRLNWYQHHLGDAGLTSDQMGLGAHTDYGILTVLLADPGPGLQVVDSQGRWRDVSPVEGGFVINTGDALAVWTNDEWTSTLHRVLPPVPGSLRRRSFAFFQDGNYDVVIECLPSCTSADRPPKYRPVTLGEHVLAKIRGGRALTDPGPAVQTTGNRPT